MARKRLVVYLEAEEYAALVRRAGHEPLSSYCRRMLCGDVIIEPIETAATQLVEPRTRAELVDQAVAAAQERGLPVSRGVDRSKAKPLLKPGKKRSF